MLKTQQPVIENKPSQPITEELIAVRAYVKWEERGCPTGEPEQDWFAARADLERELNGSSESSANGKA
jgi:hypothetical protein